MEIKRWDPRSSRSGDSSTCDHRSSGSLEEPPRRPCDSPVSKQSVAVGDLWQNMFSLESYRSDMRAVSAGSFDLMSMDETRDPQSKGSSTPFSVPSSRTCTPSRANQPPQRRDFIGPASSIPDMHNLSGPDPQPYRFRE